MDWSEMASFSSETKEETMPSVVFIIGIGLILMGCATPYQPKGFRGGYEEVEVKPGVYFLTFEGNGHTSLSTAATY